MINPFLRYILDSCSLKTMNDSTNVIRYLYIIIMEKNSRGIVGRLLKAKLTVSLSGDAGDVSLDLTGRENAVLYVLYCNRLCPIFERPPNHPNNRSLNQCSLRYQQN
jgi:hypothetical protein